MKVKNGDICRFDMVGVGLFLFHVKKVLNTNNELREIVLGLK